MAPAAHARRLTIQLALTWCATGVVLNAMATVRRAQAGLPVLDAGMWWALLRWSSWAILAAPIVLLALRFPFRRGARLRALAVHLCGAATASLAHTAIFVVARIASGASAAAVLRAAEARLSYDFAHDALIYATMIAVCEADLWFAERRESALREARAEAELRQSEAQAIREQLQPDHVSRSLGAIAALLPHDRDAAEDAIEAMAVSLRARGAAVAASPEPARIEPLRRQALAFGFAGAAALAIVANPFAGSMSLRVVGAMLLVAAAAAAFESGSAQRGKVRALLLDQRRAEAEARVIRARLEPHFLFNSLNSVAALLDRDPALAAVMLGKLRELYEAASASPAGEIAIADELALVERYLFVESLRFRDRMLVSIDCPESLRNAAIPSLLLQPLVENAVRHGIARRAAPGRIDIRFEQHRQRVRVTIVNDVEDDGAFTERGGLSLTRSRLSAHYGGDGTFAATAANGVFRVTASWPVRQTEVRCAS